MKYIGGLLLLLIAKSALAHQEHIQTDHEVNQQDHVVELMIKAREMADDDLYLQAYHEITESKSTNPVYLLFVAEIHQHFHDFDKAIKTLDQIPDSPARRLMRASIFFTQGKFAEANRECKGLLGETDSIIAFTCITQAMSLRGVLDTSYDKLQAYVNHVEHKDMDAVHWAYTALAEMAERRGDLKSAEEYYFKALAIKENDIPTRIAYTDLLLDENRYEQVQNLTKDYLQYDPLLLRYVRALNIQGDLRMDSYYCELKRRVLNYQRQDQHLHYDTMAEYYYYFTEDYEQSLKWARKHWQQQKTPRDARLLARVASHTVDNKSLDEIEDWREQHQLEDKLLDHILQPYDLAQTI